MALPATKEDAERLWLWAKKECLPLFGPYEDAMSRASRGLFHTRAWGLLCLDRVVEDVWAGAWNHHIPRLMILANIATLFEVEPRQLADWFWVAYSDAFDWVTRVLDRGDSLNPEDWPETGAS